MTDSPLPAARLRSVSSSTFSRRLAAIVLAGFLLRLAAVLWIPTQPVSDFWSYYHRGINLAEHGRYEAIPGRADANYPPLYPILLAGAFLVAPGHTLLAAKLVNCLLGAAAILLGALLTRRLWGDRAGTVAACFFAFFPRYLLLPCLIASENLFSPLFLLFVLLVLKGARAPRGLRLVAAGGFVLALAALTRTVAYYLGGLWLLAALAARKRWRAALGETLLLLAVQHAVMLPWAIRNEERLGRFTFLNTAGGYATFLGNNPEANGLWYDGRGQLEKLVPGVLGKGELAISDASNALAFRWIREHPWQALRLYFVKIGIIFRQADLIETFAVSGKAITPPVPGIDALPGPHALKTELPALKATLSAAAWLIVGLGAAGWILLARRALTTRDPQDRVLALVLPAVALYVPLASSLIAVNGRYRWPVEDMMIPVAAMFLTWLRERRQLANASASTATLAPPRNPWILETAALLSAAAILGYQLLAPPVVGLADNGDFPRVMWPVGIFHASEADAHYFRFIALRYEAGAPRSSNHVGSELLPAASARVLAAVFLPRGRFDLRFLGATNALLLLGALTLLLVGTRRWRPFPRAVFAAAAIVFFTDVGYAAPLNSFYASPASIGFLLLLAGAVVCLAEGPASRALSIGFWAAGAGLVFSKPQEAPLAPGILLLAWLLAREGRGPGRARTVLLCGSVLCIGAFLWYEAAPPKLKAVALYNNVFLEVLPASKDPRADLRELGLPEDWARYSGVYPYQSDSPMESPAFEKQFLASVGYRRIARFYGRHPERLGERLREAALRATRIRPLQLGNFSADSGASPGQQSEAFAVWSGWKAGLFRQAPWLLPVFWLLNLAGAVWAASRARSPEARCLAYALGVLALLAAAEFAVSALGDSLNDVERHLFVFNTMTDLALAADLAALAAGLRRLLIPPPTAALTAG